MKKLIISLAITLIASLGSAQVDHPQGHPGGQHSSHDQLVPHQQHQPRQHHEQQLSQQPYQHLGHMPNITLMPPPQPIACPPEDFQFFKSLIDEKAFSSDKVQLAKEIIPQKHLTAIQLAELADVFNFDSDRLEVYKFAYPYCFDPENYFVVVEALTFMSNQRDLRKYIIAVR